MHAVLPTMPQSDLSRIPCANAMLPVPYQITRTKRENHDTFTIELAAVGAPTNFEFKPGQFNMIYVHGVGEVPISISGDSAKTDHIIHTTRAVGPVTRAMQKLKRGDMIGVRGPFGTSWPMQTAERHDVVIVTGGIGLAPLRPAIYHILKAREHYDHFTLLYGGRTPADLLFTKELEQWAKRKDVELLVTVDRAVEAWRGNIGVVTTLISQSQFRADRTVAMICGPEMMMKFTILTLQTRGIKSENIYISMERNMKCAIGLCGHCQYGAEFICKDGAVFPFERIERLFKIREL